MDITKETFCKNLRTLRESAGLKQEDVAQDLGFNDVKKYQRYEQGKNSPKEPMKQALANYFKVSVADLYRADLFSAKPILSSKAELLTEIYSIAPALQEDQLKEVLALMRRFSK